MTLTDKQKREIDRLNQYYEEAGITEACKCEEIAQLIGVSAVEVSSYLEDHKQANGELF